jgi:hypothetical protein
MYIQPAKGEAWVLGQSRLCCSLPVNALSRNRYPTLQGHTKERNYIEFVGVGRVDFFNAEAAKVHAKERGVFVPQSQFIPMPTEIILPINFQANTTVRLL